MPKVIQSPIECGHRAHEKCFHPDLKHIMDCKPKGENNFPSKCPLEEGYTRKIVCEICGFKKLG